MPAFVWDGVLAGQRVPAAPLTTSYTGLLHSKQTDLEAVFASGNSA
jgi:hypothetical protein